MLEELHHISPVLRKLESLFAFSGQEKAAIAALPIQVQAIRIDQDVVREGDRPSRCFAILSGSAATYKVTAVGRRQFHAFHIAGEIPDLHSLQLGVLDCSIATLTPCQVGFITHEAIWQLCCTHPRILKALWLQTLVDGSIYREWLTNVGQRQAYGRMAHLFCEWITRLRSLGLAREYSCDLPMTQSQLADALGISTVHVNRVLKDLRSDGLISLQGSRLEILDWDGLTIAGEFDPLYLCLNERQALS